MHAPAIGRCSPPKRRWRSCASATAPRRAACFRPPPMASASTSAASRSRSSRPGTSSAAPRSCSNTAARGSSSPAITSAVPTRAPFEPVPCDVFVTEATFGLPVFRHPADRREIDRLLHSLRLFPERCHLVGVYALGKCQRLLALLRACGYDEPVYLHGALVALTELYRGFGHDFGALLPCAGVEREALKGKIVLAPPSAFADRWSRRLPDPVACMASGWMRVKQRAKARGVELPLVISDHADWDELTATIGELGAGEIWVTHGREEALVHYAAGIGLKARALALVGFEEDE